MNSFFEQVAEKMAEIEILDPKAAEKMILDTYEKLRWPVDAKGQYRVSLDFDYDALLTLVQFVKLTDRVDAGEVFGKDFYERCREEGMALKISESEVLWAVKRIGLVAMDNIRDELLFPVVTLLVISKRLRLTAN